MEKAKQETAGLRVLIADDHPVILAGLGKILEAVKLESLEETDNGEDALNKILAGKPDLAIIDLLMPNMTGIEVLKKLRENKARTKVIILSGLIERDYLDDVLKYGAKGYLLKDNSHEELLSAVKFVLNGGVYISPSVTEKLLKRNEWGGMSTMEQCVTSLSDMERNILSMLANNKTSKEIAAEFHLSFRTVQNHRTHICTKLNLKGVNSLLLFAAQNKERLSL